jgi:peptidoglycan-N-acetylglucosamine deacetylase
MTAGWNWDFEDPPAGSGARPQRVREPSPVTQPAGTPPQPPQAPRPPAYGRRRVAAAFVVVVLLVVVIAALSGSHHKGTASTSSSAHPSHVRRAPPADSVRDDQEAIRKVLSYTPFVKEGGDRSRDVALTFDDGPGPYTPALLATLERLHVRATFFVIGKMLRYFSSSVVREIEDGDIVGDHTEGHPALASLSAHDQYEQLFEQILRVEALGGHRPRLFRPPYGSFNATTMRELRRLHLLMVLWSVDTDDYEQPGVPVIVQRALEGAHGGEIILMHDGGGDRTQTIEALPQIVAGLRSRGLRPVTVPQLLHDDPPPPGQPLPPSLAGD